MRGRKTDANQASIVATSLKGDAFAELVTTWYDSVLSEEEYDAMMVQAQFVTWEVTK